MFDFSSLLKQSRDSLGLSQVELAHGSGISLPSVQNIEAGKGNPSLDTLEKLADYLGLEIRFEPKAADWDLLAALGAPITVLNPPPVVSKTPQNLLRLLRQAAVELSGVGEVEDRERKTEALQALLLALESHFPVFFRKHCAHSKLLAGGLRLDLNAPRLVRLKRQAVASLAEYL